MNLSYTTAPSGSDTQFTCTLGKDGSHTPNVTIKVSSYVFYVSKVRFLKPGFYAPLRRR